jgi:5-methylcytosine-specific restriction endonuclease McrA
MDLIQKLHEKALRCATDFLRLESELINILQEIDDTKVFTHFGFTSLFGYAVGALKLSEGQAYGLISIARKSREVPELKEAISRGTINTSQARRIVSVITPENKVQWIAMSSTLTQRELEKKIVAEKPKEAVKDKMTYIQPTRVQLVCGISEELMKEIERIKDLVSQSSGKPVRLEDALKAMATLYLEKKDPVVKAKRVLQKKNQLSSRRVSPKPKNKRPPIPAQIRHEIAKRDNGQCTHLDSNGNRCEQTKWIDLHHKQQVTDGGEHSINNIVTVCRSHHRLHHQLTL